MADDDLVEAQGVDAEGPGKGSGAEATGEPEGVEPDGTAQGGLLSELDQHHGGPGQEYSAGEGG